LIDAYTEHNAKFAPAPWGGKFLSPEKEVRFGNKSESNLFLENQKILIHFCMKQHEDMSRIFLETKRQGKLVGLLGIWMQYGLQVCGIPNSCQMVV
jgi:hypothetical protein